MTAAGRAAISGEGATRTSAKTTPVTGTRWTGTYRPGGVTDREPAAEPQGVGGLQHATSERATHEANDHSSAGDFRHGPAAGPTAGAARRAQI
ncbi:hypothetical protein, partial [Streptomyces sp. NPDC005953]|uniref:hypothetical protein n=1 Tax=Streptomyces sp. NPDC005953 TaxID=3156719 RepID=UPI0033FFD7D3